MAESTPRVLRRTRRGMTLIEILVAAAIAMIVMLAVIQIFQQAGYLVSEGRAVIELAGQVRRAGEQVRKNLSGVTVPTKPWSTESAAEGYFEILEGYNPGGSWSGGPSWDGQYLSNGNTVDDIYGDLDDVLMFTARSDDQPFIGQFNGNTIESNLAEIIIWPSYNTATGDATIHRRELLIRPDLNDNTSGVLTGFGAPDAASLQMFYNNNDVSVRVVNPAGQFAANSLSDLNKRENRACHFQYGMSGPVSVFPYSLNTNALQALVMTGPRAGGDVLLRHAISFDVRVYDPTAQVRMVLLPNNLQQAVQPGDPGYGLTAVTIGQGCYVDLGYYDYAGVPAGTSVFSGTPHVRSQLTQLASLVGRTYCTWSSHYERNGVNEDGPSSMLPAAFQDGLTDEGTDGLDNDNEDGIDNSQGVNPMTGNIIPGEQETSPPYPVPLRGVQVKIRAMDFENQQVRQITVQHDFLRE